MLKKQPNSLFHCVDVPDLSEQDDSKTGFEHCGNPKSGFFRLVITYKCTAQPVPGAEPSSLETHDPNADFARLLLQAKIGDGPRNAEKNQVKSMSIVDTPKTINDASKVAQEAAI